jgi:hypothetical protein
MTEEIINFRCPACGHYLREEEYYEACEDVKTVANEIAKRTVQEHIRELESKFLKLQRGKPR